MPKLNLIGDRYERLVVLSELDPHITPSGRVLAQWLCQCDCGGLKETNTKNLRDGSVKSCGCLAVENRINNGKKLGEHNRVNLLNQTFGRLTVVKQVESGVKRDGTTEYRWLCECECGGSIEVPTNTLTRSRKPRRSCGCLQREAQRVGNPNLCNATHGMSGTKTYRCWAAMRDRCNNPNNQNFKHYGGRGISVCDRWMESFENFYEDMGESPEGMTIERINNNLGYSPDNCKWVGRTEQRLNMRMQSNNKSGYPGVRWNEQKQRWIARIGLDKKKKELGEFKSKEEAIAAKREAEMFYWGKYSA